MKIGDKIQFTKVVRVRCELKAKTGQIGVLKEIDDNKAIVELSNGEVIETTIDKIKPYEKKEKFNISKATNEELINKFEDSIANQWQSKNTQTKAYNKVLQDIDNIRKELLNRMNKEVK